MASKKSVDEIVINPNPAYMADDDEDTEPEPDLNEEQYRHLKVLIESYRKPPVLYSRKTRKAVDNESKKEPNPENMADDNNSSSGSDKNIRKNDSRNEEKDSSGKKSADYLGLREDGTKPKLSDYNGKSIEGESSRPRTKARGSKIQKDSSTKISKDNCSKLAGDNFYAEKGSSSKLVGVKSPAEKESVRKRAGDKRNIENGSANIRVGVKAPPEKESAIKRAGDKRNVEKGSASIRVGGQAHAEKVNVSKRTVDRPNRTEDKHPGEDSRIEEKNSSKRTEETRTHERSNRSQGSSTVIKKKSHISKKTAEKDKQIVTRRSARGILKSSSPKRSRMLSPRSREDHHKDKAPIAKPKIFQRIRSPNVDPITNPEIYQQTLPFYAVLYRPTPFPNNDFVAHPGMYQNQARTSEPGLPNQYIAMPQPVFLPVARQPGSPYFFTSDMSVPPPVSTFNLQGYVNNYSPLPPSPNTDCQMNILSPQLIPSPLPVPPPKIGPKDTQNSAVLSTPRSISTNNNTTTVTQTYMPIMTSRVADELQPSTSNATSSSTSPAKAKFDVHPVDFAPLNRDSTPDFSSDEEVQSTITEDSLSDKVTASINETSQPAEVEQEIIDPALAKIKYYETNSLSHAPSFNENLDYSPCRRFPPILRKNSSILKNKSIKEDHATVEIRSVNINNTKLPKDLNFKARDGKSLGPRNLIAPNIPIIPANKELKVPMGINTDPEEKRNKEFDGSISRNNHWTQSRIKTRTVGTQASMDDISHLQQRKAIVPPLLSNQIPLPHHHNFRRGLEIHHWDQLPHVQEFSSPRHEYYDDEYFELTDPPPIVQRRDNVWARPQRGVSPPRPEYYNDEYIEHTYPPQRRGNVWARLGGNNRGKGNVFRRGNNY